MSKLQIARRRTIMSAALLALAVLAGCESTGGKSRDDSSGSALAGKSNSTDSVVEAAARSLPEELTRVGDRVHFALDRHDLSPEAEATLQQQATLLQQYPQVAVTIQGHADERGTREHNLGLGEMRANSVRNYLVALGVPPERIAVISFGKERPECAEAAESCWTQNRRGVTVVNP